MELKTYIAPLMKWWWLILAAALVAAVSSFLVTQQQPPVYQARTTLVIGRSFYEPNPTSADMLLGEQLAAFYADLAKREPVRNATMTALGLSSLPEYVAQAVANSQLIEIEVTDTDPKRAQAVANELANQLILQSPAGDQSKEQDRQKFIDEQLTNLQDQINSTSDELLKKQEELGTLFSARQIADAEAALAALRTKLTTLQTNFATLLANSERGAKNALTIIEPAALPRRPIGPQRMIMVMLATAIGVILASASAYLLEYLDDTLKTPEDITRITKAPVIGYVTEIKEDANHGVHVVKEPRSAVAEAFRTLRTNLEFAAVDKPLKTLLVTSSVVAEGKTTVSVNLAAVLAQGGRKVILMDADLRIPSIHEVLDIPNQKGLSDVFRGNLCLDDAIIPWNGADLGAIPSGKLPPNPADLISSMKMDTILAELSEKSDIVIIDGPPFIVSETGVLANKVDGVLLIIRYAMTRKGELSTTVEKFHRAGAKIAGVVLNGIPRVRAGNYGYGYYSQYYGTEEQKDASAAKEIGRQKRGGLFGKARKALSNVFHAINFEG
jgi:non-specific protein-tyrosine kinase